jgi:hypothetical protein
MGTGSQRLPIAREPQNLTISGHGGGPGTAPCAIRAHPVQPLLRLRERSGGGGRGERVDGVRATAAGQTAPPRRSAARAGGPVLGHGFGERPSGPRCTRMELKGPWNCPLPSPTPRRCARRFVILPIFCNVRLPANLLSRLRMAGAALAGNGIIRSTTASRNCSHRWSRQCRIGMSLKWSRPST